MCKIAVLTNMTKIAKSTKVINEILSEVSRYDNDGMGFAVQGEHGVYGERYCDVTPRTQFNRVALRLPFTKPSYNKFGWKGKIVGSGIFHGRTSTNNVTLTNTHPIVKYDWSLIHNGVVTNEGPKYETTTTNDSEHVLHYLANGGIDAVAANLTGYYASAALSPDGFLHVFRDDRASLYWTWVDEIDSYFGATTQDIIENVCKEMKWKWSVIEKMDDNTYLKMKLNEVLEQKTFKPRGATARENRHAQKSLGIASFSPYDDDHYGTTYTGSNWRDTDDGYRGGGVSAKVIDAVAKTSTETLSKDDGGPLYSENEILFFEELEFMDSTWTVLDQDDLMDVATFAELTPDQKLSTRFTIVRSDGTWLDPNDPTTEKMPPDSVTRNYCVC